MNKNIGKVIVVSSVKGGVGKTTTVLNLAGIYNLSGKKVLIIDLDLCAGGVATLLNIDNKKDIYMLVDGIANNRFTELSDYVISYNNNIDVLSSPTDPRNANKIQSKYIPTILNIAKYQYDVVLVDTNHIMNEISLTALDNSYNNLFIITNDLVDIKNMRNMLAIFKETGMKNYYILLNNSRDIGRDYISMYDIRSMIDGNVDFTILKHFYIKNIDKYVLNGEILTLNKTINRLYASDIDNIKKMAFTLLKDNRGDADE